MKFSAKLHRWEVESEERKSEVKMTSRIQLHNQVLSPQQCHMGQAKITLSLSLL